MIKLRFYIDLKRMLVFIFQKMFDSKKFQEESNGSYYEDFINNNFNLISKWFHKSRYGLIREFVEENYSKDKVIVDLGCGSCSWNINKLSVIGVDINNDMLKIGKSNGKINKSILSDLDNIKLPDKYADIIIISEVLEHLNEPKKVLLEIDRILKKDGIVLISVPYDIPFTLWYILFNFQCFILGVLFNKEFYKNKGGHVNHFSKTTIRNLILETNLKLVKQFTYYKLTIYNICKK